MEPTISCCGSRAAGHWSPVTRSSTGAGASSSPRDWADKGVPPEQILETLQPLLGLPVEFVLPTHGAPTDRAALERALA